MLALIRRALDAKRLTQELEDAEKRIEDLEHRLASIKQQPHFMTVATRFNASDLHAEVRQRVIEDLSPVLERAALQMLKHGMGTIARNTRRPMTGLVAYDHAAHCYEFHFESPQMGTIVKAMK